jgi:hypothetical protein
MAGWWSENSDVDAYMPPDNAGNVMFNMSSDCSKITGAWRYGTEGEYNGDWEGTRE